jgi:hypothetical protein
MKKMLICIFVFGLMMLVTSLAYGAGDPCTVEDTTQATSSGFQRTLYSVRVDHELLRNLQLMGQLSYYHNDYQLLPDAPENSRKSDKYFVAGIGATYFFNRWSWLSLSYNYGKFTTNVPLDDFKVNDVWLVVGFEK